MKKLTTKYVFNFLKQYNYELLDEYKNSKIKLKMNCPNGHTIKIRFNDFQQGHRCSKCSNNFKYTVTDVKNYFKKFNYEGLFNKYKNNRTNLKIKCPNNHITYMTFGNFKQGSRCLECSGLKKKDINFIKKYISKFNYECLSNEYKNYDSKLELKCPKNHIFQMSFHKFKSGQRCLICSGRKKYTIEEIKEYTSKYGYTCLSNKYNNSKEKLKFKCNKNHNFEMMWESFKKGNRCSVCKGNKKKTLQDVIIYFSKYKYKCLSDKYINANSKLKIQCPNNHLFEMTFNSFQQGRRCKECYLKNNFGENHPRWNPNKNLNKQLRITRKSKWIKENMSNDSNYNDYLLFPEKYNLDHIIPVKAFCDYIESNDMLYDKKFINKLRNKIINVPSNLQLLTVEENNKKSFNYKQKDLLEYLDKYL